MNADHMEKMNARLKAHDILMTASDLTPEEQMGVFIMATVLACRRVLVKHNVHDGKKRKIIRDAAVKEFTAKLRTYTMPNVEGVAEPEAAPIIVNSDVVTANEVRAAEGPIMGEAEFLERMGEQKRAEESGVHRALCVCGPGSLNPTCPVNHPPHDSSGL